MGRVSLWGGSHCDAAIPAGMETELEVLSLQQEADAAIAEAQALEEDGDVGFNKKCKICIRKD